MLIVYIYSLWQVNNTFCMTTTKLYEHNYSIMKTSTNQNKLISYVRQEYELSLASEQFAGDKLIVSLELQDTVHMMQYLLTLIDDMVADQRKLFKAEQTHTARNGPFYLTGVYLDRFMIVIKYLPELLKHFPREQMHPFIIVFLNVMHEVFEKQVSMTDLRERSDQLLIIVKRLNLFVDRLRQEIKSRKIQGKYRHLRKYCKVNQLALEKYIHGVFERSSKIMAVRVDFSYTGKVDPRYGKRNPKNMQQVKSDFKHLLANRRHNKLFKNLIGMCWAHHFGGYSLGHHIHSLWFYDGQKCHQDVNYGRALADYWKNVITKGHGYGFNVNADKKRYGERLGIGMIHRSDMLKRRRLMEAASYLTKIDELILLCLPYKGRSFGRIALARKRLRGRPRKNSCHAHMQHLSAQTADNTKGKQNVLY